MVALMKLFMSNPEIHPVLDLIEFVRDHSAENATPSCRPVQDCP